MSLLDLTQKILVNVQADTSQARAELKNLTGAEREAAKAAIEASEQRNSALDGYVDKIGKVGLALNTVSQVVSGAMEGLTAYGENLRLEFATSKVNTEELIDSFDGLIAKHDALVFASKALHAAMPLTQAQMDQLGKDAVALSHEGLGSVQEITEKLTDSVVGLKSRGLKDLGIVLNATGDDTAKLGEILDAVHKKAGEAGTGFSQQADDVERARIALKDFGEEWDIFKGELVLPVGLPEINAQLEQMVELRDKFTDHSNSTPVDFEKEVGTSYDDLLNPKEPEKDPWAAEANVTSAGITRGIVALGKLGKKYSEYEEARKKAHEAALKALEEKKKEDEIFAREGYAGLIGDLNGGVSNADAGSALSADIHNFGVTQLLGVSVPGLSGQDQGVLDSLDAGMEKLQQKAKAQNLMEQLFGKPDELTRYQVGLNAISAGLHGMADAAAAGLDALLLGQKSGAKAFSEAIGSQLHAIAVKELTMGMVETGEGIASLFIDPAAAPGHFAAAAEYTAIGAAADLAARGLGYGASSSPSTGSSSSGGSSAGGSGGSTSIQSAGDQGHSQTTNIFVVGDPAGGVTGTSPRMQQTNFQRVQTLVQGSTGVAFK